MNRRLRTTLVVSAALSAGLLMTACGGGSTGASDSPSTTTTADTAATGTPTPAADAGATAGKDDSTATGSKADSGSGAGTGTGAKTGSGAGSSDGATTTAAADKTGYGQGCGTNDLSWSAKSMTQAGGYYQISVKAKSGITCVLPGGLPVIAFGSGGTQAGPAEQVAGEEITLSGGRTVYAGVSPKTTNSDAGVEYGTVIVSVSENDPNPVSLKIGNVVVDKPVVTNWHTDPADAVPFTS